MEEHHRQLFVGQLSRVINGLIDSALLPTVEIFGLIFVGRIQPRPQEREPAPEHLFRLPRGSPADDRPASRSTGLGYPSRCRIANCGPRSRRSGQSPHYRVMLRPEIRRSADPATSCSGRLLLLLHPRAQPLKLGDTFETPLVEIAVPRCHHRQRETTDHIDRLAGPHSRLTLHFASPSDIRARRVSLVFRRPSDTRSPTT